MRMNLRNKLFTAFWGLLLFRYLCWAYLHSLLRTIRLRKVQPAG